MASPRHSLNIFGCPLAQVQYEKSLEVFEAVEDHEKVAKILINLANMCELQMKDKVGADEGRRLRDIRQYLILASQTIESRRVNFSVGRPHAYT